MTRLTMLAAGMALGLTASVAAGQSSGGGMGMSMEPAAPAVGTMAPDFSAPWADASGTRAAPVHL
jgi:hypothetical protein